MVFGTFDLLHPGHEFVLREAMKLGRVTIVVARAENVLRMKGRAPTESDAERCAALRKAFPEGNILLGDAKDFLVPVLSIAPDLILLGYDQKLPPGVTEQDLHPAVIERLPAFKPRQFKSSLLREAKKSTMS